MYLTLNSEFKPFTYDELVKPLSDYTEAYNKVEEQYATLAQQTEAWKNIATQENSPKAYAMYKRYSDELNAVIDDFSRGMTIQNRSKLTGLKSRYNAEIGAIDQAYKAMQAANAYRDQALLKDPTSVFTKDRYTSIDEFLNGEIADNSYISGNTLETSLVGKIYAAANAKFGELMSAGMSADKASKMIISGQAFNTDDIVNKELKELGIDNYDIVSQEKLKTYANAGVAKGFGTFIDKQTLTAAQREDSRLRRASIAASYASTAESARQFNINLRKNGYDSKGNVDINSPVWKMSGYQTITDKNGNVSLYKPATKPGESSISIDLTRGVNAKGKSVYIRKDDINRSDTKIDIISGNTLNPTLQHQLATEHNLSIDIIKDISFDKITLSTGEIVYVPHAGDMHKINIEQNKSFSENSFMSPTNFPLTLK